SSSVLQRYVDLVAEMVESCLTCEVDREAAEPNTEAEAVAVARLHERFAQPAAAHRHDIAPRHARTRALSARVRVVRRRVRIRSEQHAPLTRRDARGKAGTQARRQGRGLSVDAQIRADIERGYADTDRQSGHLER